MDKDEKFFNGFDDDIITGEDIEEGEGAEGGANNKGGTDNPTNEEGKAKETGAKASTAKSEEGSVKTEEGQGDDEAAKEAAKKAEEAEKNAKFAEERRKREAEAKAKKEREEEMERVRKEATVKAELGSIKTNPYTNEPIVDEEDLKVYKIQKELEDAGKDPVKDLPKKLAEIERSKADEAKKIADAKKVEDDKLKEKAKNEVADFRKDYPDINTAELAKDPIWNEIYDPRLTIKENYEWKYLKAKESAGKKKEEDTNPNNENVEENGKKISKVPSAGSNGGKTTPKNYLEMSDEEYLEGEKKDSEDFF